MQFMKRIDCPATSNIPVFETSGIHQGQRSKTTGGASLKDAGRKCFALTKLDAGEIRRIKKLAFHPAS